MDVSLRFRETGTGKNARPPRAAGGGAAGRKYKYALQGLASETYEVREVGEPREL